MAKVGHPYLDVFLRDISARTGLTHVYGNQAFAQRKAPGKIVVWTPPTMGTTWIEAEKAPAVHVPEGDIFCVVKETCGVHYWGEDLFDSMAMLFRTWREGFDRAVFELSGQKWRHAISYGTVSQAADYVPETGNAITDRVVVQYLLPRQGELFGEIDQVIPMSGLMIDNVGEPIGEI